jgi:hypothetical protein
LQTWQRISDRKGEPRGLLKERPYIRPEAMYMVTLYNDVSRGAEKLSFEVLHAYECVAGMKLTAWEADCLLEMDKARYSTWQTK